MKKINLLAIFLIFVIVGIFVFEDLIQFKYLQEFDPYYFYAISDYIVQNGFVPLKKDPFFFNKKFTYPPLLVTLISSLSLISNLDVYYIIKFGSLFLFVLTGLLIFVFSRNFFHDDLKAIFSVLIFLFLPYSLSKSTITLSENLLIVFEIFLMFLSLRMNEEKNFALFLIILFITFMTHTFAFVFFVPILSFSFFYNIKKFRIFKKNKYYFAYFLLFLFFVSLYLYDKLDYLLFYYLKNAFPWWSDKGLLSNLHNLFEFPKFKDLTTHYTFLFSFLFILSFIYTLINFKKDKNSVLVIFCLISFVLISFNSVNSWRFYYFFGIPLSLVVSNYFVILIKDYKKFFVVIVFLFVTISLPLIFDWHYNNWLTESEVEGAIFLRNVSSKDSLVITQKSMEYLLMPFLKREILSLSLNNSISKNSLPDYISKISISIKKDYPNKEQYIFVSKDKMNSKKILSAEHLKFNSWIGLNLTDLCLKNKCSIIMENENISIYRIN